MRNNILIYLISTSLALGPAAIADDNNHEVVAPVKEAQPAVAPAASSSSSNVTDPALFPACPDLKVLPGSLDIRNAKQVVVAKNFLIGFGEFAQFKVDLNNHVDESVIHCARQDKAWFEQSLAKAKSDEERSLYDYSKCSAVLKKVHDSIDELGPKFREERALSHAGLIENKWLSSVGEKMPLDKTESDYVAQMSKQEEVTLPQIRAEVEPMWRQVEALRRQPENSGYDPITDTARFPRWFRALMADGSSYNSMIVNLPYEQQRRQFISSAGHQAAMGDILGHAPMLDFLHSRKPKDEEIAAAFEEVKKNGVNTSKEIGSILFNGKQTLGFNQNTIQNVNSLTALLKYGPLLNAYLAEHQDQCGVAASMIAYLVRQNTKETIALAFLSIGGSLATLGVAGWASAAGAGALLTTGILQGGITVAIAPSYLEVFKDYVDAKNRLHSAGDTSLASVSPVGDGGEFVDSRDAAARAISEVVAQAVVMGGSAAGAKLIESLARTGVSQAEAERLVARLANKDLSAASEVGKKLGLDGGKVESAVISSVAKQAKYSQPLISQARSAVEKASQVNPAGADAVTRDLASFLSKSNAVPEAARADAMRAGIAEANFGVKDGNTVASTISTFDKAEQFKGLEKAYTGAKSLMNDADVAAAKSPEAVRAAAMGKYLDSVRGDVADFKSQSASDWEKLKGQMVDCAMGTAR